VLPATDVTRSFSHLTDGRHHR